MIGILRKTCSHSVKAIFTKDQKHFYAVRRGNMDVPEGLAMYESKNIFNPDKHGNVVSSFLSACQVGNKSFIDYSFSNTRISYMKDVNTIEIIPLLHENTLSFFSMPERDEILTIKRDTDRFYCLTFTGEIYGWDIATGKLVSFQKLPNNLNFVKYKHLSNTEKNEFSNSALKSPQVVICSKKEVQGVDCADYQSQIGTFFNKEFGTGVENLRNLKPKKLHRMKVIELVDAHSIRIVKEFKWPLATDYEQTQFTLISDSHFDDIDGNYLWE
jgi:hypothetical protein